MEGIRGTTHPLDTPLILECIFKKLHVSELKTCRQVNRLWHEAATKCMRPAVVVGVRFEPGIHRQTTTKMRRFTELVRSRLSTFQKLPFAYSYKLEGVRVDYYKFWAFCGSNIKSLHLNHIQFHTADLFRHVIFKSCPHLENLVLNYVTVTGSVIEEPVTWVQPRFPQNTNLKSLEVGNNELGSISFLELFSHFPSLEEVHSPESRDTRRIFQSLATCREHDPQSWNIKSVSFKLYALEVPESDFRFVLDDSLALETLRVFGVLKTEHVNVLRNILEGNATTLKSLKLKEFAVDVSDRFFTRMMEKLVDFSLINSQISSPSLLRWLPNLKKLDISDCRFLLQAERSDEQLNHWIVSSCTELTLDLRFEFSEDGVMERYFQLFRRIPNLERLSVSECTNELFAGICEYFPNLVYLEVLRSWVDDCGLSGLDKEHVNRDNKGGPSGRALRRPASEPRPNISNLKSLKWFRYRPITYRKNRLGFRAVQRAVLQLPQLQHLQVEGWETGIWDRLRGQFPWREP